MSTTKVTGMMQTSTKGGDISSASPCVIDTDGDYFDVTGTTNFAAFTVVAGRRFTVQFDGVLTMTHHATDLDLPGGANIATAAGDVAEFFATAANKVQCVNYTRASGAAVSADIADESIDSDHYVDGSIDNAHIADDAIDSEHYADGSIDEAHIANNAVSLAKMAGNTDGVIISFDASGDPVAVGPGSDGEVLTSTGAGSPPAFEAAAGGAGLVSNIVQTTYDLSTSAGTQDITGAGFDPLHVIAIGGVTGTPPVYIGFMDDNGVERMIDNYHSVTAHAWQEATALIRIAVSSGNYQYCSAVYITDGIRLTWLKGGSPTGTILMKFFFMK